MTIRKNAHGQKPRVTPPVYVGEGVLLPIIFVVCGGGKAPVAPVPKGRTG